MIVFGAIVAFWYVASQSIQSVAALYRLGALRAWQALLAGILILPYFVPALFLFIWLGVGLLLPAAVGKLKLDSIDACFGYYAITTGEFMIVAAYIRLSGGYWYHSTKSGRPDLRYKYNSFIPYYDDWTKKISEYALVLPGAVLAIFLLKAAANHYAGKP